MTTEQTTMQVMVGGLLGLAVMGCGSGGHAPTPTFEPGTDRYRTVTAGLEAPRADHSATRIDGTSTVLVAGGETILTKATNSAEVFDPRSGSTRAIAGGMTTARAGHFAVALDDGRILIGGGQGADGRPLDTMEVYDPKQERFTQLSPRLQRPRIRAGIAVIGSQVLLAGGRNEDTLERVSLQDFTTALTTPVPGGPRDGAQLVVLSETEVLLYGGSATAPAVWIDPTTRTYRLAENEEIAREGTVVRWRRLSEDGLVIVGGRFGTRAARNFQIVTPDDRKADRPVFSELGLFHARSHPAVLVRPRGLMVFGGTLNDLPVASGERQLPAGSELLPDSAAARTGLVPVALRDDVIVLIGGRGADGRPTALVDIVLPPNAPAPDGLKAFRTAAEEEAALAALEQAIGTTGAERDAARVEVSNLADQLAIAQSELGAAEATGRSLTDQLQQSRAATAAAAARAQQLTAEVAQAVQRRDQLRRDAGTTLAARAQAEAQVSSLQRQADAVRRQAVAGRARIATLDGELTQTQQRISALRRTVSALRAQR